MSYWAIFLTGLTTGGLSCAAVQGGLLAATLAGREHQSGNHEKLDNWYHDGLPTVMFLISKLIAHIILGALLGYFGSLVQLSAPTRAIFQVAAGIMMLGLAANMLELHPVFRYFVIQPPKWVGKLLRNQSKSQHLFAPAILGVLTVLIPCGVTQAMEVLAISSGNPVTGALIMGSFVLGTSPVFMLIGWLTTKFSETLRNRFFKIAAVLVVYVALSSINNALVLTNSKYSFDKWVWAFKESFVSGPTTDTAISQNVTIQATGSGYSPSKFSVKSGELVTLTINTKDNFSCSSIFTIPSLKITKTLPPTGVTTVSFTPDKVGPINFSCGMGMYRGVINVI
jgi:uncharacterized protein